MIQEEGKENEIKFKEKRERKLIHIFSSHVNSYGYGFNE